ncbi:MAG: class I SAM-dependent methyltransferase [Candidatus Paceibacterota bacterium]|jgi:2-polyprenyl-3-methyl-5-hydroxy-6-metoxy-1,4-benzoquinol methylase
MKNVVSSAHIKESNIQCCVCGSTEVKFFTRKESCDLYKCKQCGFIFVYPAPGSVSHIYSEDYFSGAKGGSGYIDYEKDKEAMRDTIEIYLDEIEKLMPTRGKLFDIGAATGTFLEAASRRGWQVSGVEISDYAASKAREKNLNVQTGLLENLEFKEAPFDVITMWDVLEHLPNPESTLKSINKLMKPKGLIAINTPNAGSLFARVMGKYWHLIVPPEHLSYFSVANLTKLLEKTDMHVRRATCLGKKFTPQYILRMLAVWHKFSGWRWLADRIQNTFLGRIAISINLHDNLFLIAEKRSDIPRG